MKHSSVPAYSFGKKTPAEPVTTDKLGPSPDTYNIRPEENFAQSRSFPRAPRSASTPKIGVPGPGSYNIPDFLNITMSYKKRKTKPLKEKGDKSKIDTPGPASYNPIKHKTVIGYSMGNKTFSLMSSKENPAGPGQYDPNYSSVKPVVRSTIGNGPRAPEKTQPCPGPGSYSLKQIKEGPSFSFSKDPKGKNYMPDYPGPGDRSVPVLFEQVSTKTGKTILPRRPLPVKDSDFPGPGAYSSKVFRGTPSYSVGRGKRPKLVDVKFQPGPGQYTPTDQSAGVFSKSIGTGLRPPLSKTNKVPGPGSYEFSTFTDCGPKYSAVSRKPEIKSNLNPPGPGAYDPDFCSTKPEGVHTVVGTGKRGDLSKNALRTFPGPGAYDPQVSQGSPKWTFAKDLREKISFEDEPGPGYYEIPPSVPDVPKYLVLNKKK